MSSPDEYTVYANGSIDSVPSGIICPFAGEFGNNYENVPYGYLACDGQEISRTQYASLFAIIGTIYGNGDGINTFNVPDFRGEFLRGAGTNSHTNQGSGGTIGQHQDATQIPSMWYPTANVIQFGYKTNVVPQLNRDSDIESGAYYQIPNGTTGGASGYGWITLRPTNTSVNWIIKY